MGKRVTLAWDGKGTQQVIQAKNEGRYIRERSATPYHTKRWTIISKNFRIDHPFCENCRKQGIIREAQCVDHIIPFPICDDFYDTNNLQSLCNECNTLKGEKDREKITQYKQLHPDWMLKHQ